MTQSNKLSEVKAKEDKKVEGITAAKVEGTTEELKQEAEVKIDLPVPEGMVQMKNITKANVFASNGKMLPGEVMNVTESDAKLLKEKELCIEVE